MLGVWMAPVTAQVMMTFFLLAMSFLLFQVDRLMSSGVLLRAGMALNQGLCVAVYNQGLPRNIVCRAACRKQCHIGDIACRDQASQSRLLVVPAFRSEEHTSELQSLMRNPYAVLGFKK